MDVPCPITDDTPVAKFHRSMYPTSSYCSRCGMPWQKVTPHQTRYTVRTTERGIEVSGCFPLCEFCWDILETLENRMKYYVMWYDWIIKAGRPALSADEKLDLYLAVKLESVNEVPDLRAVNSD
jgi:hypothetical protein